MYRLLWKWRTACSLATGQPSVPALLAFTRRESPTSASCKVILRPSRIKCRVVAVMLRRSLWRSTGAEASSWSTTAVNAAGKSRPKGGVPLAEADPQATRLWNVFAVRWPVVDQSSVTNDIPLSAFLNSLKGACTVFQDGNAFIVSPSGRGLGICRT
jgi:hypothetical protein